MLFHDYLVSFFFLGACFSGYAALVQWSCIHTAFFFSLNHWQLGDTACKFLLAACTYFHNIEIVEFKRRKIRFMIAFLSCVLMFWTAFGTVGVIDVGWLCNWFWFSYNVGVLVSNWIYTICFPCILFPEMDEEDSDEEDNLFF